MVRTPRTKSRSVKQIGYAALALLVIGLVIWCIVPNDTYRPWLAWFFLAGTLGLAFWALYEQSVFSCGKSRYPTRTERKRLLHQRKKKSGDE